METYNQLCQKLVVLTKNWNATDRVPQEEQDKCREIGVEIHKLGGCEMMQNAYYHAKGANQYVCVIQAYWDNIGEWRW